MEKQKNVVSTGIKVKKSRTDRIFDFFLYLIAFIIILIVLYPMSVSYTHLTLPTILLV